MIKVNESRTLILGGDAPDEPGEYDYALQTANDSVSGTLTVVDPDCPAEGGGNGEVETTTTEECSFEITDESGKTRSVS